jgi:hypothetical protein
VDEYGVRRSTVFPTYREAEYELRRRQVDVEEIRRGLRSARPPDRTFDKLRDYWIKNRVPRKRSGKDNESTIRLHLRPAFGHLPLRGCFLTQLLPPNSIGLFLRPDFA